MQLNPQDLRSPPGESWQQALIRLERVCRSDWEYFEDDDGEESAVTLAEHVEAGELLKRHAPQPGREFDALVQAYGLQGEPALRQMLCGDGGFSIHRASFESGVGDSLMEINQGCDKRAALLPNLLPLTQAIGSNFTSHFADKALSAEQRSALDSRFFAFGRCQHWEAEVDVEYLLLDAAGGFTSFLFAEGDYPSTLRRANELLAAGAASEPDFDRFLVQRIQWALMALMRSNDFDPEACGA